MVAFKRQSLSPAAVCIRGQRLMMPTGSGVRRLIGALLSAGRTPGHVWSLEWERRSESGGSGNSRSTCSAGMRMPTCGSVRAAPSRGVVCGLDRPSKDQLHTRVCARTPCSGVPPRGSQHVPLKMQWTMMITRLPLTSVRCRARNQESG